MHIGDLTYQNGRESRLRLTYRPGEQAQLQSVDYRQTDERGTHRIDADLARLRHSLTFSLSPAGGIDGVLHPADVLARYKALQADWVRRYLRDTDLTADFYKTLETIYADSDRLVRNLQQSPELELLLPALYNRAYSYDDTQDGPPAFISPLNSALLVPLRTTVTRRPPQYPDVALDLLVTGQIDEANFPYEDTRELLQELTGVVDIDPMPEIQYLLTFEFDAQHHLRYAGRFVTCMYENLAMSKDVTLLSPDATP